MDISPEQEPKAVLELKLVVYEGGKVVLTTAPPNLDTITWLGIAKLINIIAEDKVHKDFPTTESTTLQTAQRMSIGLKAIGTAVVKLLENINVRTDNKESVQQPPSPSL